MSTEASGMPGAGGGICSLCGGARSVALLRSMMDRFHPGGGAVCSLSRCMGCGIVFATVDHPGIIYPSDYEPFVPPTRRKNHARPTRDRIHRVFFEGKGTAWERVLLFLPSLVVRLRDRWKLRNKRIYEGAFRRGGRLLDVGCGRGHQLFEWMKYQDEGVGVEPHESTAVNARMETGLDIRPGTLEAQRFPPASFDRIAFCHVLEHIENPKTVLLETHRVLKPSGEVVLWLPNFDSFLRPLFGRDWMPYDTPRHLWHFTSGRLSALLRECGFRPIEITMDPNEYAFRRSVRMLRESGRTFLAWVLGHRSVRMLLGLASAWIRRADVMRVRARKA